MALNDLTLALFDDLLDHARWTSFLSGLLARTRADRLHLLTPDGLHRVARHDWASEADDSAELSAFHRHLTSLRPRRVYALDELRELDSQKARDAQDQALVHARIGDARIVRLGGRWSSVWMILLAEQNLLTATDSALLSRLLPALEIALTQLATFNAWRRRAEAAEDALALQGIAQAVINASGDVLAADPLWQSLQLQLPPQTNIPDSPSERQVTTGSNGTVVLLRPATEHGNLIAAVRTARTDVPLRASHILVQSLGLSKREAMLAVLLAQGHSLIEAGRSLNLSDETTRSYSKRIYSKTGTAGQADLVRCIMTSLAPLA